MVHSSEPFSKEERFTLPHKGMGIKQNAKEVLKLLTIDFLTPKEIAQRRKTSLRAVYKVISNLKKKGVFDSGFNLVNLSRSTPPCSEPFYMRLHGQEWNIDIIQKSEKYAKIREKANTINIDGNTIRLYRSSLEIYSGRSFFGKDENTATAISLAYWERFLARLEHEFGIILVKPRVQNIKLVNQHYGETDAEIAKDALSRKEKIKITTEEDGKLWFIVDNSFNLKEMETIHPETAKHDMTKVQKQVNDWRNNDPPTNSELASNLGQAMNLITLQANNLDHYAQHLKAHVESVQKLGTGVEELVKVIKELKGVNHGNS